MLSFLLFFAISDIFLLPMDSSSTLDLVMDLHVESLTRSTHPKMSSRSIFHVVVYRGFTFGSSSSWYGICCASFSFLVGVLAKHVIESFHELVVVSLALRYMSLPLDILLVVRLVLWFLL